MTSNQYVRKILAFIIGVLCATLAAWLITPLISKDNESFFAWDYYTFNKIGIWLYTFGYVSILARSHWKIDIGALFEFVCIAGIFFLFVDFCTFMERIPFFWPVLCFFGSMCNVVALTNVQDDSQSFKIFRRIKKYLFFYIPQFWGYLILNRWFRIPKHISLLIADVILLLIVLMGFMAGWMSSYETDSADKTDEEDNSVDKSDVSEIESFDTTEEPEKESYDTTDKTENDSLDEADDTTLEKG